MIEREFIEQDKQAVGECPCAPALRQGRVLDQGLQQQQLARTLVELTATIIAEGLQPAVKGGRFRRKQRLNPSNGGGIEQL